VQARLSIVFAGHPGAGKTTLMSCTAAELDPALRVVVAEEVFEADIRPTDRKRQRQRVTTKDSPRFALTVAQLPDQARCALYRHFRAPPAGSAGRG
jgi:pilus assembly protein CpaF